MLDILAAFSRNNHTPLVSDTFLETLYTKADLTASTDSLALSKDWRSHAGQGCATCFAAIAYSRLILLERPSSTMFPSMPSAAAKTPSPPLKNEVAGGCSQEAFFL